MAKDPAFLFYSQDFTIGTQFFNHEQVGKYIRLLCAQHQHGRLSEKHMLSICVAYDADIFEKFIRDESGNYYNERLENESTKRKKFTESRKKNATPKKHMLQHMENENENRIDSKVLGGVGEKEKEERVLTDFEIGKTIEYIQITGQRLLTSEQVRNYWKAFLIHSESEVHRHNGDRIQHFRNWLKKQPNELNTNRTGKRTSKAATADELAAYILGGSPNS